VESGGFRPGLLQGGEIRIHAFPQIEEFRVRFFRWLAEPDIASLAFPVGASLLLSPLCST